MDTKKRPDCPTASRLKQIINCPKSFLLEKQFPNEETEASKRGTYFHLCVENWLERQILPVDMTADDAEAVKYCIDVFTANRPTAAEYETETRFYINRYGKTLFSGQIDAFWRIGDRAGVFDWKSGERAVDEATDNLQLMAYAWLMFDNIKELQTVEVNIVAPFVKNGKRHTKATYRRADIDAVEPQLLTIIEQATEPTAPYAADVGDYCQYCRARSVCEIQTHNAQQLAAGDSFAVIDAGNAVELFEKLEVFNKRKLEAEKWAESLQKRLELYVAESKDDRFTFERGRKLDTFDTLKTFSAVEQILPPTDFLDCCKVNKKALVDKLSAVAGLPKSKAEKTLMDAAERVGAINRTFAKSKLVLKTERAGNE